MCRLYYDLFQRAHGPPSGGVQVEDLQRRIDLYSESSGSGSSEKCAALSVDSDNAIVVICTLFMKRVYQMIVHSGELVFLDSSGNMDRHNYRVPCLSVTDSLEAESVPILVVLLAGHSLRNMAMPTTRLPSLHA